MRTRVLKHDNILRRGITVQYISTVHQPTHPMTMFKGHLMLISPTYDLTFLSFYFYMGSSSSIYLLTFLSYHHFSSNNLIHIRYLI